MNVNVKEQKIKRRRIARLRFRGLVRIVIANVKWLLEVEDAAVTSNVRKNIEIIRRPREKGILTLNEKALINKPHWLRTEEERKKIAMVLVNLTCFSSYPPKLRARLTPYVKYFYFIANRTIIREGHPSKYGGVYFVLDGEVILSQIQYDAVTRENVDATLCIFGAGDSFGDCELIVESKRVMTVTTSSEVELLFIAADDFGIVLKDYMTKEFNAKIKIMKSIDMLSDLTEDQLILASKLSYIKEYQPFQAVYYDDNGILSPVYFLISGECMILQFLNLKVTVKNGQKHHSLATENESETIHNVNFGADTQAAAPKKPKYKSTISFRTYGRANMSRITNLSFQKSMPSIKFQDGNMEEEEEEEEEEEQDMFYEEEIVEEVLEESVPTESSSKSFDKSIRISSDGKMSKRASVQTYYENHFVDVGTLTPGAIFGLGERMEQRAILAKNTVQCLHIPRYWLLERRQNVGNKWQRLHFFLDVTIPSREALFKDFMLSQKWKRYQGEIIEKYRSKSSSSYETKIDDIPIVCRIINGLYK